MSGPKTSRYTLTAEQRRILAEQRRIQQEIQKNLYSLKKEKKQIRDIVSQIDAELSQYERIIAETGDNNIFIEQIKTLRNVAMDELNKISSLSEKSGLPKLESADKSAKEAKRKASEQLRTLSREISKVDSEFMADVNAAIGQGFELSFMNIEVEVQKDASVFVEKIEKALDEMKDFLLSEELQEKFDMLRKKAEEIESVDFLENYYAMSIVPFVKECKAYHSLLNEYGSVFEDLLLDYAVLIDKLGKPKNNYTFSMESIKELRKQIKELQLQVQKQEEQVYINECIDKAMHDMGYCMIGEREIIKKNSQRFNNELYLFGDDTAVNVTYSSEGQITMELGGLDEIDRVPRYAEIQNLEEDMVSFCDDYHEIERRLLAMGISVQRILVLPPDSQFAQIINTTDYKMNADVKKFEARHSRSRIVEQQQMRRGES